MSNGGLVITSDTLTPGLKAFPGELERAVMQTVDYSSLRVEAAARTNAPWTDQTGNARNLLTARAFHNFNVSHGIDLAHGVPYGIWLETRFEGKYAIILPTIKTQGIVLMNLLRTLFARMPGRF